MRLSTRTSLTLALAVLLVTILAACSGGGATASPSVAAPTDPLAASPSAPAASPSAASEAPGASAPAAGGETVAVADSSLGQILVDGEGMTLYLFKPDTAGASTCYDDCAAAWPPLLAEGDITVGEGLDASAFSTVERTDGTLQVKVGDWPLYYFANDGAPGDVNGQGISDVWYVVSPAGEAIE